MEETCAACGRRLAPDERLCPNCGHPTPALVEELRAQAARTGQPYEALLAIARAEHLIDRAFERVSARLDRLDEWVSDLEARLRRVEEAARAVEVELPPAPAPSAEGARVEAPPSPAAPGPAPAEAMPEPAPAAPRRRRLASRRAYLGRPCRDPPPEWGRAGRSATWRIW